MQLVIDVGNTRTKVAIFDQESLVHKWNIEQLTRDFIIKHEAEIKVCGHAIISNVNTLDARIVRLLNEDLSVQVLELDITFQLPVTIDYKTPKTLGVDRLALATGAKQLYEESDVLVVSIGTCMTIEFVTADAIYCGGSIHPGPRLRYKAMNDYTANLPLYNVDFGAQESLLTGKSTEESMRVGVETAMTYEIEGFVRQYQKLYPRLKTIITGGYAPFFESRLNCKIFVEPNLALIGLNKILLYNA